MLCWFIFVCCPYFKPQARLNKHKGDIYNSIFSKPYPKLQAVKFRLSIKFVWLSLWKEIDSVNTFKLRCHSIGRFLRVFKLLPNPSILRQGPRLVATLNSSFLNSINIPQKKIIIFNITKVIWEGGIFMGFSVTINIDLPATTILCFSTEIVKRCIIALVAGRLYSHLPGDSI